MHLERTLVLGVDDEFPAARQAPRVHQLGLPAGHQDDRAALAQRAHEGAPRHLPQIASSEHSGSQQQCKEEAHRESRMVLEVELLRHFTKQQGGCSLGSSMQARAKR
jgi:hypothetical protein